MGKRKAISSSDSDALSKVWWVDKYSIEQEILVDPVNEMTLLGYAEHRAQSYFVSHLKMMAMNGSNHLRQTRFIFNNTLTTQQRHSIHRMQHHLLYHSISVDGYLNIFIK
jgi:hypothetical protein